MNQSSQSPSANQEARSNLSGFCDQLSIARPSLLLNNKRILSSSTEPLAKKSTNGKSSSMISAPSSVERSPLHMTPLLQFCRAQQQHQQQQMAVNTPTSTNVICSSVSPIVVGGGFDRDQQVTSGSSRMQSSASVQSHQLAASSDHNNNRLFSVGSNLNSSSSSSSVSSNVAALASATSNIASMLNNNNSNSNNSIFPLTSTHHIGPNASRLLQYSSLPSPDVISVDNNDEDTITNENIIRQANGFVQPKQTDHSAISSIRTVCSVTKRLVMYPP